MINKTKIKLEKKRTLKKTKKMLKQDIFNVELTDMLTAAVVKYERLLYHKDGWSIDDGCRQEILDALDNLTRRLIYRASLFAMHRSGAKNVQKLKKQKIAIQEDDLDMAWKTLDI